MLKEQIDLDWRIGKTSGKHKVQMGLFIGKPDLFGIKILKAVIVNGSGKRIGKKTPQKPSHVLDLTEP
jgi:hypothetical protein